MITGPLVSAILGCSNGNLMAICSFQSEARVASRKEARAKIEEEANVLWGRLPRKMKKAMGLALEKGASAWLTTLPLAEEGFNLHKQAFRDALCLRYGWDMCLWICLHSGAFPQLPSWHFPQYQA